MSETLGNPAVERSNTMIVESPNVCAAPTVSVLIISFNHARYVAQAVESVAVQKTSFPFEIVIGDDCSTDGTQDILRGLQARFPDRIRLVLHEKNLGELGKLNFVATLGECRGEYLAFLEGDDFWNTDQKLQRQFDHLQRHPEQIACCHDVLILGSDGKERRDTLRYPAGTDVVTHRELIRYAFPHAMSIFVRRKGFPGFPPWYLQVSMGDWTISIVMADHGPIGYLKGEWMGTYRLHPTSFWLTRKLIDRNRDEIAAMRQFDRYLGGRLAREFGYQINRREFWEVDAYSEANDWSAARRSFWRAMSNWFRYRGQPWEWVVRYFVRSHIPALRRYRARRAASALPKAG